MLKLCKKCGAEKPLDAFSKKAKGKASRCKTCCAADNAAYRSANKGTIAEKIRAWHARNPGRAMAYYRKNYQTVEGRARHLRSAARQRRPSGFTLTLDDVVAKLSTLRCAVTGVTLDLKINGQGVGNRSWSPYAPSLDRIDSRKGYTNANTRVVAWQYNIMKGELTDAEILDFCRRLVALND